MKLLTSAINLHNSKLFFSKEELKKILNCYSLGVSRGNWKDYAIHFSNHKASFYIFKHSLAHPDCILTKSKKYKKNIFLYNLQFKNKNKSKFTKIDDLIVMLRRSELKIIY